MKKQEIEDKGIFKLSKPMDINGETKTELNFPIDDLTGGDLVAAQDDFEMLGNVVTGPVELNKKYQAFLVARISKVPFESILALSAKDFTSLTLQVQRFLLS